MSASPISSAIVRSRLPMTSSVIRSIMRLPSGGRDRLLVEPRARLGLQILEEALDVALPEGVERLHPRAHEVQPERLDEQAERAEAPGRCRAHHPPPAPRP